MELVTKSDIDPGPSFGIEPVGINHVRLTVADPATQRTRTFQMTKAKCRELEALLHRYNEEQA